jgi:hypothetical protein
MLYVAPQWQQHMQPPVLSHGAEAGFLSRFIWDGCRDYAPLLAISSAVKWWKGLGAFAAPDAAAIAGAGSMSTESKLTATPAPEPAAAAAAVVEACCDPSLLAHPGDGGAPARCYMYGLLRRAADFLSEKWGTECLAPPSMTGAMALVRLPEGGLLPAAGAATSADAKYVQVRHDGSYGLHFLGGSALVGNLLCHCVCLGYNAFLASSRWVGGGAQSAWQAVRVFVCVGGGQHDSSDDPDEVTERWGAAGADFT